MDSCREARALSTFTYICSGVVTVLLAIFGIVGITYSHRRLRRADSRISKYLLNLCVWDALLLLSATGLYGLAVLLSPQKLWHGRIVYLYIIFYPIVNVSMCGSVWLVLTISAERFLAVYQPLRHVSRGRRGVRLVCYLVLIASLALNLPTAFEMKLHSCSLPNNRTSTQMLPGQLRLSPAYSFWYRGVVHMMAMSFLPFVFVVLLTVATLVLKHRALRTRSILSVSSVSEQLMAQEGQTTALLTVVMVKFFLTYALQTLLSVLELFEEWARPTSLIGVLHDISNVLVVANSATNWIIFCQWKPRRKARVKLRRATLSPQQMDRIACLWARHDKTVLGIELFTCLLENQRFLEKFEGLTGTRRPQNWCKMQKFGPNTQCEEEFLLKVGQHGQMVGNFLDQIVKHALSSTEIVEITRVGALHAENNIQWHTFDWFVIKNFLLDKLLGGGAEDEKLVCTFASHVIRKMKLAFVVGLTDRQETLSENTIALSCYDTDEYDEQETFTVFTEYDTNS